MHMHVNELYEFVALVRQMRDRQKAYDKRGDVRDKVAATALAARVDSLAGKIEAQAPKQPSLPGV